MIVACVKPLYEWVRTGDKALRLSFLRELGEPEEHDLKKVTAKKLCTDFSYIVVATLVKMSKGRDATGSNEYGFYPYGKAASYSTNHFKSVPDSFFAITLSEMYLFVSKDKDTWSSMQYAHPITNLWPWATVKKHMNFQAKMRKRRLELFELYESEGGEYHGEDKVVQKSKKTPKPKPRKSKEPAASTEEESEESETSDDFA